MFRKIRELLQRLLGKKNLKELDEINERLRLLEDNKADLEGRVISAEKTKELMIQVSDSYTALAAVKEYLNEIDIKIPETGTEAARVTLDAAAAVEKYHFKRWVPKIDRAYPSAIISLKEFREHPEQYIHKLSKGLFNFPLGLDLSCVSGVIGSAAGRVWLDSEKLFSNSGIVAIDLNGVLPESSMMQTYGQRDVAQIMQKATQISDLNRIKCNISYNSSVYFDIFDFLANREGLIRFIAERTEIDDDAKARGIKAIELAKYTLLTAMETVGKARIRNAADLLNEDLYKTQASKSTDVSTEVKGDELKEKIKKALYTNLKGTTYDEIQKLLQIRSIEEFRSLASLRTAEILAKDTYRSGLTDKIGKDLKDYTIGECVVMACYFARNIITRYSTLENLVKEVFGGKEEKEITGKCSDYTGLALHYLKEYLIPLNPEKFMNWHFGYETEKIGDYKHCYMKIVHVNSDYSADVYFVDPTMLANKGIHALKTPKKILKYTSMDNSPIQIERDAEDLLRKPIE